MNTIKIGNLSLEQLKIYKDEARLNLQKYERLNPTGQYNQDTKTYQLEFNRWRTIYEAFEREMNKRIEEFI